MRRPGTALIALMVWAATAGPGWSDAPDDLVRRAEEALAAGDAAAAESALERALAIDPARWDALCRLGDIRLGTGRLAEAETAYRKAVAIEPGSGGCQFALARSLLLQDRPDEAEEPLVRAAGLLPGDVVVLFNLGRLQEMIGKPEKAIETYRKFLEVSPPGERAASIQLRVARLLSGQHRPFEAAGHYAAFLEQAGEDPGVRLEYADALMQASLFDESLAEYEKVIASETESPRALGGAGALHIMKGDLARAIERLERAVALEPGDPAFRIGLATALAQSGDHRRAVDVLEELVTIDAENERAWFLLGRSLMELGRKEEAQQAFVRHRAIHEKAMRERMSGKVREYPQE